MQIYEDDKGTVIDFAGDLLISKRCYAVEHTLGKGKPIIITDLVVNMAYPNTVRIKLSVLWYVIRWLFSRVGE